MIIRKWVEQWFILCFFPVTETKFKERAKKKYCLIYFISLYLNEKAKHTIIWLRFDLEISRFWERDTFFHKNYILWLTLVLQFLIHFWKNSQNICSKRSFQIFHIANYMVGTKRFIKLPKNNICLVFRSFCCL